LLEKLLSKGGNSMKSKSLKNGSKNDNWETPKYLYDELNKEFNFDFDPCPLNSSFDGLSIDWKNSNYVNPPYSFPLKDKFIEKAYNEWKKGKTIVLLIPSTTDTISFHKYIYGQAEIRFIKGRVKFRGYNTKGEYVINKTGQSGSMIVIFRGNGVLI
jgi:hypothetical protein